METPHVNAVGLVAYPEDYQGSPRSIPKRLRILAAAMIVLFGFAVITTTVVSIGQYCLTSDGGDTRDLPSKQVPSTE